MKANEAPEKIYISTNSQDGTYYISNQYKRLIEYTCTDSVIEKMQLFLIDKLKEIPMGGGKMKIKADCSLEEFIDEFGNYMKGE